LPIDFSAGVAAYKAAVPRFFPDVPIGRLRRHYEEPRALDDYRLRPAVPSHLYSTGFRSEQSGAFVVFIILMFACHFMMLGHHHGGEDADEKAPNTIKTTPKRTMTVIQKLTEYATTTQKGRR
jgi:hypothetical protein